MEKQSEIERDEVRKMSEELEELLDELEELEELEELLDSELTPLSKETCRVLLTTWLSL